MIHEDFWSPIDLMIFSRKIHGSQVFKTKILDSYMFCNYDSWFMIPLSPPSIDKRDWKANLT